MNYIEALQALICGKKVREKCWGKDEYVYLKQGDITTNYGDRIDLTICDLEDLTEDSWEIYQTEEERLIQAGKRWELYITCANVSCGVSCDTCMRHNLSLYRYCQKIGRDTLVDMLADNRLTDNEVDKLYNALKGEIDA